MSEHGIKETKEAAIAVLRLSGLIAGKLKDGFQVQDLVDVVTAAVSDPVLKAGLEGVSKVPAEAKDLQGHEWGELLGALTPEVVSLITALVGDKK